MIACASSGTSVLLVISYQMFQKWLHEPRPKKHKPPPIESKLEAEVASESAELCANQYFSAADIRRVTLGAVTDSVLELCIKLKTPKFFMLFKSLDYQDVFLSKILGDGLQEENKGSSAKLDFMAAILLFSLMYSEVHYRRFYFQSERMPSCSIIFMPSSNYALSKFILRNLSRSDVSIVGLDFLSRCFENERIPPAKADAMKSRFVQLMSDVDVCAKVSTLGYLCFVYLHLFSVQLGKLANVDQHVELFKNADLFSLVCDAREFPLPYKLDIIDAFWPLLPHCEGKLLPYLYGRSRAENVSCSKLFKSLMNMIPNKATLLLALSLDGFNEWICGLLVDVPDLRDTHAATSDAESNEYIVFYIGFLSNFFEKANMLIIGEEQCTRLTAIVPATAGQQILAWFSKITAMMRRGSTLDATFAEALMFPFLTSLCGHVALHLKLCNLYDSMCVADLKTSVLSALQAIINAQATDACDTTARSGEPNFLEKECKALFNLLSLHLN
ncbi:hypothetical protein MDAP_002746 [Mitosporidium daphniae]